MSKIKECFKEDSEYKGPKGKFWKFWSLMAVVFLCFIFVIIRLFNIQVIDHEEYVDRAKRQHESKIDLRANRGSIFDKNGKTLATTFKTLSVAVDPTLFKSANKVTSILSEELDISKSKLLNKINRAKGSFVWLARGVNKNRLKRLKEIDDKGLLLIEEPKRNFPYRKTSSQIIGFTNIDNKGISGIELEFDSVLLGRSGFMHMYRDGLGRLRPSPELPIVPPVDGNNIELTIDVDLQRIVEYELTRGMDRLMASAGTVIAIEPSTGNILAMASYPMFDPYNINKNSNEGMRLRGITDVLEPGSTFKLITAAAALEEEVVDEEEVLNGHQGQAVYRGGAVIRDVHPMGKVDFRTAMQNSSNIILGEVANRMDDNVFYKYIRDFGFGLPTGIDLPGEASGKVPKPDNFHANSKRYMGHGYGLSVTPLQLVNSYAAVANGGNLMKPHIINKITRPNGEVIKENKPEVIRQVVSEETCHRVTDLLVTVVDSGSGERAKIEGLKIAGKTGTSQKIVDGKYSKSDYNASFVGYFPAEKPELALIVIVENPRRSIYGGFNAAPIFKNIAARWMGAYGYEGREIAEGDSKMGSDSLLMPNLLGLKSNEAEKILNIYNLEYDDLESDHFVYNQYPRPGQKIRGDEEIIITTGNIEKYAVNDTTKNENDIKHDVTGFPLRRAINLLQSSGVNVEVQGNGFVKQQVWGKNKSGELVCKLICR